MEICVGKGAGAHAVVVLLAVIEKLPESLTQPSNLSGATEVHFPATVITVGSRLDCPAPLGYKIRDAVTCQGEGMNLWDIETKLMC